MSRYMDRSNGSPQTRVTVRVAVRIVALVALLAGVVFFFQGVGVIPGSFMTGRSEWAVIGAALVAGAVALIWLSGMVGPGRRR
jgi:hypothetical protein